MCSLKTPSLFLIHQRLWAKSAPAHSYSQVHPIGRGPGPGADVAEPVPVLGLPLAPPRDQGPPLLGVQHELEVRGSRQATDRHYLGLE